MPHVRSALLTHDSIRAVLSRDDAEALMVLREACANSDHFIRRTAIEIIGRHPGGQALRAIVLKALADPSEYVVRTACEVVAHWRCDPAHDAVTALLRDPAHATRRSAIRAISAIWRELDFQPVFRIYTSDPDRPVRREAAWTLRERVTASDWLQLFEAFRKDDPPRHRVWACELAGKFGDSTVTSSLETLLSDCDGHVRTAAATATDTLSRREPADSAKPSR